MDCNFAIAVLSGAHVISLGIFAGYRIKLNKKFIELEKKNNKEKKNNQYLNQRVNEIEKKLKIEK